MSLQAYVESFNNFLANPMVYFVFMLLSIWALVWKGFALWKAAKFGQRNWFIALLVLNTFGILEIIYLFYLSKPKIDKNAERVDKSV